MNPSSSEVVVVGGGIAGICTAYYLGKAGVKSVVVERDALGAHASGFAYGGIGSVRDIGLSGPMSAIGRQGVQLHKELSHTLPGETGMSTHYRERPSLSIALTVQEAESARSGLQAGREEHHRPVRWVDSAEARSIEPRISPDTLGGTYNAGRLDVEPYRLVLAVARAAEKLGATIRHGRVTGLRRSGDRVQGVVLENDTIACRHVVLAMGPWTGEASAWMDIPVPVGPLKGQILRLQAPGPPLACSIGWGGNYLDTKSDGLVWGGTTEEEVGFDERPTIEARDYIMKAMITMAPYLAEARLTRQTACLRPLTPDRQLLLGRAPGWEGVYIATGAGRSGISVGPAMGRVAADLITTGATDISIDAFDPGRLIA